MEKKGMGRRCIEALRWIGAVVLPIPIASILSLMLMKQMGMERAYLHKEEWPWNIVLIVEGLVQGIIIPMCAYGMAPRAKFRTASIIGVIIGAIGTTGTIISSIIGTSKMMEAAQYLALPIGIATGIIWLRKEEKRRGLR